MLANKTAHHIIWVFLLAGLVVGWAFLDVSCSSTPLRERLLSHHLVTLLLVS